MRIQKKSVCCIRTVALVTLSVFLFSNVSFALRPAAYIESHSAQEPYQWLDNPIVFKLDRLINDNVDPVTMTEKVLEMLPGTENPLENSVKRLRFLLIDQASCRRVICRDQMEQETTKTDLTPLDKVIVALIVNYSQSKGFGIAKWPLNVVRERYLPAGSEAQYEPALSAILNPSPEGELPEVTAARERLNHGLQVPLGRRDIVAIKKGNTVTIREQKGDVTVVGSGMVDYVVDFKDKFPAGAPIEGLNFVTHTQLADWMRDIPREQLVPTVGGPGMAAAMAVKNCGKDELRVNMATSVGGDDNGKLLMRRLADNGISTEGIIVHISDSEEGKTAVTFIPSGTVQVKGEGGVGTTERPVTAFLHAPGAGNELKETGLKYKRGRVWHLGGVALNFSFMLNDMLPAMRRAREEGVIIVMDTVVDKKGLWRQLEKRGDADKILANLDVLTVSQKPDEIGAYINFDEHPDLKDNPEGIVKYFLDKGVKTVIYKMGEKGCMVGSRGSPIFPDTDIVSVPVYSDPSYRVVGGTGMGDAFAGAFSVAVEQNYTLGDAVAFATAVASKAGEVLPGGGDIGPEKRAGAMARYEKLKQQDDMREAAAKLDANVPRLVTPGRAIISEEKYRGRPVNIVVRIESEHITAWAASQDGLLNYQVTVKTPQGETVKESDILNAVASAISKLVYRYGRNNIIGVYCDIPAKVDGTGALENDVQGMPALLAGSNIRSGINSRLEFEFPRYGALGAIPVTLAGAETNEYVVRDHPRGLPSKEQVNSRVAQLRAMNFVLRLHTDSRVQQILMGWIGDRISHTGRVQDADDAAIAMLAEYFTASGTALTHMGALTTAQNLLELAKTPHALVIPEEEQKRLRQQAARKVLEGLDGKLGVEVDSVAITRARQTWISDNRAHWPQWRRELLGALGELREVLGVSKVAELSKRIPNPETDSGLGKALIPKGDSQTDDWVVGKLQPCLRDTLRVVKEALALAGKEKPGAGKGNQDPAHLSEVECSKAIGLALKSRTTCADVYDIPTALADDQSLSRYELRGIKIALELLATQFTAKALDDLDSTEAKLGIGILQEKPVDPDTPEDGDDRRLGLTDGEVAVLCVLEGIDCDTRLRTYVGSGELRDKFAAKYANESEPIALIMLAFASGAITKAEADTALTWYYEYQDAHPSAKPASEGRGAAAKKAPAEKPPTVGKRVADCFHNMLPLGEFTRFAGALPWPALGENETQGGREQALRELLGKTYAAAAQEAAAAVLQAALSAI